jgi:hypothetical protein
MKRAESQIRPALVLVALGALNALLWSPPVLALDPSLDVSQYAHKSWKVREGFFNSSINTIEQTPDGYLWIGTDLACIALMVFEACHGSRAEMTSCPATLFANFSFRTTALFGSVRQRDWPVGMTAS